MSGRLLPLLAGEQAAAYAQYRAGMMAGLAQIAHWDEAVQRQRFDASYRQASLYWYVEQDQPLALLSLQRDGHSLRVHLLIVPPGQQRNGRGRRAMQLVHALCRPGEQVLLSCLRHDRRVRAFYAALGYRIVRADSDFLDLCWQAAA